MKTRWILIGASILLVGAGAAAALLLANHRDVTTGSSAAYQAYNEAVANEYRFYYKEARVGYARALELDPNFAMAILGLARQSGDDQARALVRRASREESRVTERERLNIQMQLAYVERRPEDGLKIARQLHEKYPDDVRSAMMLARKETQSGQPDQAIKIFEELLAINPNNAEAYNQIGYYYGYRGNYDKAMEHLKKYQFIAPDTANPFDSLGENQAYAGHYAEAIENLNRALAVKADFSPAYEHLGVVYEGMGDPAKAVESYKKALELADGDEFRGKYVFEGLRAAFQADDVEAVNHFRAIMAKLPKNPYSDLETVAVESAVLLHSGRAAEVEAKLTEVLPKIEARWREIEHKPAGEKFHFAQINFLLARAKQSQGKVDEAMRLWEANANPPKAFSDYEGRRWIIEARAELAVILAKKGDLDAAEKLIAGNRKWNASWAPTREAETTVAELRRAKVLAASK